MTELPTLTFDWPKGADPEALLSREWLLTNGLGGYASGTLAGCNTRRYHGLFVPSLRGFGRTVLLPHLMEQASVGGEAPQRLDAEENEGGRLDCGSAALLREFRLEGLIPRWEYEVGSARLSRRILMVHGRNTVFVEWTHLAGPEVRLSLRPYPAFRFHDRPMLEAPPRASVQQAKGRVSFSMRGDAPPLRLRVLCGDEAVPFEESPAESERHLYRVEQRRGLDHLEQLHSPGRFELLLRPGARAYLGLTVEDWDALEFEPGSFFDLEAERERHLLERAPEHARAGTAARLVLAADQFIIAPSMRPEDETWASAGGGDARSIIAGYHWFTDWGRDTMISLDGLTLHTGRHREAAAILRTFQHYVRDGLLPNLFPEGGHEGLYHTADATLWFFHAIDRYLERTGDEALLRDVFPTLASIVEHHLRGTRYGIRVDPSDGLLTQGEEGYQLTWMDAKVDGWVVTPRRGKAVELNALWFNAMRLMEGWASRLGRDASAFAQHAERAQRSFNARFWNPGESCLFDVVDGEGGGSDAAIRPNQVFAISVRHPVLAKERWHSVLDVVERELLTPVGMRTLHRGHGDYQAVYEGDLRARDAAYHQGTVWPWLLGHFVDAWLKLHGDRAKARQMLGGLERHLRETGVGQVSEIFDAEPPFHARGCVAQAWSVAELLRCWENTGPTS